MSEAATGIVVLTLLSAVSALVAQALIRRPMVAATIAAIVASLLFQIAASIHLGYLDPFAPIAFVFGAILAFVVAMVVRLVIRLKPADARPTLDQERPISSELGPRMRHGSTIN